MALPFDAVTGFGQRECAIIRPPWPSPGRLFRWYPLSPEYSIHPGMFALGGPIPSKEWCQQNWTVTEKRALLHRLLAWLQRAECWW